MNKFKLSFKLLLALFQEAGGKNVNGRLKFRAPAQVVLSPPNVKMPLHDRFILTLYSYLRHNFDALVRSRSTLDVKFNFTP